MEATVHQYMSVLARVVPALRGARRLPLIPLGVLIVVLFVPGAFAPWIAPSSPTAGGLRQALQPPLTVGQDGTRFLFGTDHLGRDIFSRVIYGARVSLTVALIAIFISASIGTTLGLISGYYGGVADAVLMRLVDVSLSLPGILLAMVLVVILQPGFSTIIIVVSVSLWSRYARLARGETLSVKERDFVALARIAGASTPRILFLHILPNIVNSLIVLATLQVGYAILLEASLSFLGLGISPPTPAWGLMVAQGRHLIVSAWWVPFFPGLAISLAVLCLNLTGDWLRDRLDPRLSQVQG